MPAHLEVITTYLRGMKFEENDLVVFADILPNRLQVLAKLLNNSGLLFVDKYFHYIIS